MTIISVLPQINKKIPYFQPNLISRLKKLSGFPSSKSYEPKRHLQAKGNNENEKREKNINTDTFIWV